MGVAPPASEKGYKETRGPSIIMNLRARVIRDEIHRDILVPGAHASIIDTPEFQRLRAIQQLSTCEYVFPAATHNRFATLWARIIWPASWLRISTRFTRV